MQAVGRPHRRPRPGQAGHSKNGTRRGWSSQAGALGVWIRFYMSKEELQDFKESHKG